MGATCTLHTAGHSFESFTSNPYGALYYALVALVDPEILYTTLTCECDIFAPHHGLKESIIIHPNNIKLYIQSIKWLRSRLFERDFFSSVFLYLKSGKEKIVFRMGHSSAIVVTKDHVQQQFNGICYPITTLENPKTISKPALMYRSLKHNRIDFYGDSYSFRMMKLFGITDRISNDIIICRILSFIINNRYGELRALYELYDRQRVKRIYLDLGREYKHSSVLMSLT